MRDIPIGWLHARAIESYYRRHPEETPKRRNTQPRSYTGVVYKYTNRVNGMAYVGQTVHERKRKNDHREDSARGCNIVFHKAIKKYGWENFDYEVLYKRHYLNEEDAKFNQDLWEVFYINYFDSYSNGYNCNLGGGTAMGYVPSEEMRQKLSEKYKGRKLSEETRKRMSESRKGRICPPRSEEFKRKMSLIKKGCKPSEEARRKMSEAQKGRIISLETRRKRSEALKGRVISEETRKKLSIANKGRKLSEEARRRIREASLRRSDDISRRLKERWQNPESREKMASSHRGKPLSDEHRRKISEGGKGKKKNPEAIAKAAAKRCIPIVQLDPDGNLIREWPSAAEAARELGINSANISSVCKRKLKSYMGSIWRYKSEYDPDKKEEIIRERTFRSKIVLQLDPETNEVVKEWKSAAEASRFLNKNTGLVSRYCRAKITMNGYKWRYKD